MSYLRFLCRLVVCTVLFGAFGVFVSLEPNVFVWNVEDRAVLGIASFGSAFFWHTIAEV